MSDDVDPPVTVAGLCARLADLPDDLEVWIDDTEYHYYLPTSTRLEITEDGRAVLHVA